MVTTQSVGKGICFSFASGIHGYIDIEVSFEDGLLSIHLGKVVPEHHARKDYL